MANIYKRASKLRIRFQSPLGMLSVEDLWEIPLQSTRNSANLDDISKALNKSLKNDNDFSLIEKEKKSDELIQLKFDIVKDVIETRLAERDARAKEKEDAERRQKIMGIIADKKDKNLHDMPIEELEKLLAGDSDNK